MIIVENLGNHMFTDANAVVFDCHLQLIIFDFEKNCNKAVCFGEFDGVWVKVKNYLLQPAFVSGYEITYNLLSKTKKLGIDLNILKICFILHYHYNFI